MGVTNFTPAFKGNYLYTITEEAGTTYTLVTGDTANFIQFTNGSAVTLTIPPNSSVPIDIGMSVSYEQAGAGVVTATAGVGVTITSAGSAVATGGKYAVVSLLKVATDTWVIFGNIV